MIGGRRSIILVGVARGLEDGFGKLDTGFLLDGFADGLGSLVAWDDDFLMLEEFSSLEELQEILNNEWWHLYETKECISS